MLHENTPLREGDKYRNDATGEVVEIECAAQWGTLYVLRDGLRHYLTGIRSTTFRREHSRIDAPAEPTEPTEPTEIAYHGEVNGLLRLDDRPGLVGVAIHMNIGTEPVIVEVPFADAPRLGDRCRIVFVR